MAGRQGTVSKRVVRLNDERLFDGHYPSLGQLVGPPPSFCGQAKKKSGALASEFDGLPRQGATTGFPLSLTPLPTETTTNQGAMCLREFCFKNHN